MTNPDFESLRAGRNAKRKEWEAKMRAEGYEVFGHCSAHDDNACYCACPEGPCEHKWDGDWWTSEDGCASSATCSRCGTTAMSHDLRCMP